MPDVYHFLIPSVGLWRADGLAGPHLEQPGQRVRELARGAMIVKALSELIQQPRPRLDLAE